jgi:hypothetical protein
VKIVPAVRRSTAHWQGVPEAARAVFPPVERIMAEPAVRLVL